MAGTWGTDMHALTLSIADAAKAINVSRPTIYKLIQSGNLQTFTVGRRRLVTPEALRDYIHQREKVAS